MAQRGAYKHDQWQGYMTVLAAYHGIIKSISFLTADIYPRMKFNVDNLWNCSGQEVKLTLAMWY
jgi:hypothetical protein